MKDSKLRVILRHTALTILALLSMALSWIIWTNPARYERSHQQVSSEKVQSSQVSHDMSDVILPTQLIRTDSDQKQTLLAKSQVNLNQVVTDKVAKWKFESVRMVSKGNKERYLDYAREANSLLLKYPSNIAGGVLNEVLDQKLDFSSEVGRIVISLDKNNGVYLLNDKNYGVYQVQVSGQDLSSLKESLTGSKRSVDVKESILNHNLITEYQDSYQVPNYSYVINKQSNGMFSSNLLANDDSATVTTKKEKDSTVYSDGNRKQLTINKDGTARFEDYTRKGTDGNSLRAHIENGFYQLREMGVPMDNMRFFNYTDRHDEVVFRSYVEGYPIFNDNDYGTVTVSHNNSGRVTDFSLYGLEIPVPADKKETELPSTKMVLSQLEATGINSDDISDIQIGYQWTSAKGSGSTINLTPTWYVNYKNNWYPYDQVSTQG